jgi:hypothetical protein
VAIGRDQNQLAAMQINVADFARGLGTEEIEMGFVQNIHGWSARGAQNL